MQNRVTKTMSVAPLLGNNWGERSPSLKPSSTSLLLISSGLTWGSSTTSLLLTCKSVKLLRESPAHLPPLDLAWTLWVRKDPIQWYIYPTFQLHSATQMCTGIRQNQFLLKTPPPPPSHSSGAVWESRWPSWAVRPYELSGFRGRKAILNHASALVSACP